MAICCTTSGKSFCSSPSFAHHKAWNHLQSQPLTSHFPTFLLKESSEENSHFVRKKKKKFKKLYWRSEERNTENSPGTNFFNILKYIFTCHCSLMSQHAVNDSGFIVAVCKMMSDKVSSVLSNFLFFFFFFLSALWASINNSWSKITVPEKGSLFHQPFHTLLINTYNFLMCNSAGVLKNRGVCCSLFTECSSKDFRKTGTAMKMFF